MLIPNGLVAIWFLPIGIKFFHLMHLYAIFAKSLRTTLKCKVACKAASKEETKKLENLAKH
jgi:hypothetical protein